MGTNPAWAMQEVAAYINYTLNLSRRDIRQSDHPKFVKGGIIPVRAGAGGLGGTLP